MPLRTVTALLTLPLIAMRRASCGNGRHLIGERRFAGGSKLIAQL
jgi:hypothetical protein